jgi:FG-GAP repeat
VAPLSTSTVTSRRPTLRWALAEGTDGARVELCADRACTRVLATIDAGGTSAAPAADLAPGVVYWRLRGLDEARLATVSSPTWEMFVGQRSAGVDTSWGTVPDFDGDGLADVVLGATGAFSTAGQAYVFPGTPSGIAAAPSVTLDALDGGPTNFGWSVASAGDVDGDGYADLLVSAACADPPCIPGGGPGTVYLYLGGRSGIAGAPSPMLDPGNGLGSFGYVVASAGDVDGDGYADVIVGDPCAGATRSTLGSVVCGSGSAYLYRGGPAGLAAVPPTILHAPPLAAGSFAWTVASAGDVDGDGYGDVVIGTTCSLGPTSNASCTARAYLYLGSTAGLVGPITSIAPGVADDVWVSGAGDVDGDGYADVVAVAGCVSFTPSSCPVSSVLVYPGSAAGLGGSPLAELVPPEAASAGGVFVVAGVGDVNGDGFADVLVGAPFAVTGAPFGADGRAYLYLGAAPGSPLTLGAAFDAPPVPGSDFGFPVAGAGDVDGDGYADVLVGATNTKGAGGLTYLLRGSASGLPAPGPASAIHTPDGELGVALARHVR